MALTQPYLIDGIPAGKVERGTPEFAIFEHYADEAKKAGWVSPPGANALVRWWKKGRAKTLNRQLAQYGWKMDEYGHLIECSVLPWVVGETPSEPQDEAYSSSDREGNPFESGRIQIRSGYVVDTFTNQKCNPKDMYRLKNIYG